jgi:AcrR family transcriptional regulator
MFTKKDKIPSHAETPRDMRPGRGRPRGATQQGVDTRRRLYETALQLIATHGYEATTLRDVAKSADVSVGLIYKYFPSKRAVVLSLYDTLSAEYADRGTEMEPGKWRDRFLFALQASLDVLRPHRKILLSLIPVLVGDPDQGLFASGTTFSRIRVQSVFQNAVLGASDAPPTKVAEALGRLLYMLHLSAILLWLLDKSPRQRATTAFIALLQKTLASFSLALRLAPIRSIVCSAGDVFQEAILTNDYKNPETLRRDVPRWIGKE